MSSLTITSPGGLPHLVPLTTWDDPVSIGAVAGEPAQLTAAGASVMVRFGAPGLGATDVMVIYDGDTATADLSAPAWARCFADQPIADV